MEELRQINTEPILSEAGNFLARVCTVLLLIEVSVPKLEGASYNRWQILNSLFDLKQAF